MTLYLLVAAPLTAAFLSLLVRTKLRHLEFLCVTASLIELCAALYAALEISRRGSVSEIYLYADALGAILILIIAVIGLAASTYSVFYLREETAKGIIGFSRVRQFYILLHLFMLAMFCAVTTDNPTLMWIATEATTLSTAFLISYYNEPSAMEAAWKYLIINSVGLLLGFLGTLLYLSPVKEGGLVSWQAILSNTENFNPALAKTAFVFVLIGYGTKAGLVPMHTWLPDAHSKAPVPISGLLSGVLLNVALFAILRFKTITDHVVGPSFSHHLLMFFGLISIALPAFMIFIQRNYKRLLAYSSIENMGIIALGFGAGGIGAYAVLLHMLYHAIAKSILFLSAGNIFLKYSSTKIENIKGIMKSVPLTGALFFGGVLALGGIPPSGVFMTKIYLLSAVIRQSPFTAFATLFSFILLFAGMLRHTVTMSFGEAPETLYQGHFSPLLYAPFVFLAGLFIILSVYLPAPLKQLIESAASKY